MMVRKKTIIPTLTAIVFVGLISLMSWWWAARAERERRENGTRYHFSVQLDRQVRGYQLKDLSKPSVEKVRTELLSDFSSHPSLSGDKEVIFEIKLQKQEQWEKSSRREHLFWGDTITENHMAITLIDRALVYVVKREGKFVTTTFSGKPIMEYPGLEEYVAEALANLGKSATDGRSFQERTNASR